MSVSVFASTYRRWSLRYLLLALVAVPAILLGILGMHFIASNSLPAGPPAAGSLAETTSSHAMIESSPSHKGVEHSSLAASADDCDGTCVAGHDMPGHSLMGMVCILALVIYVLIFFVPVLFARGGFGQNLLRSLATTLAGLASPSPPSLSMLSLSRR